MTSNITPQQGTEGTEGTEGTQGTEGTEGTEDMCSPESLGLDNVDNTTGIRSDSDYEKLNECYKKYRQKHCKGQTEKWDAYYAKVDKNNDFNAWMCIIMSISAILTIPFAFIDLTHDTQIGIWNLGFCVILLVVCICSALTKPPVDDTGLNPRCSTRTGSCTIL